MVEGKEVLTCKKWGVTTIRHILENQTYAGDTINNKSTQKLFAGQDKRGLPKEQWYVAKNTHPAIIARDDFEKVQKILNKNRAVFQTVRAKSEQIRAEYQNDLAGMVFCADCGRPMEFERLPHGAEESKKVCRQAEFEIGLGCPCWNIKECVITWATDQSERGHYESDSMAVKIDVGDDNPAADPCCVAGEVVCGISASLFCMVFLSAGQCAISNGGAFVSDATVAGDGSTSNAGRWIRDFYDTAGGRQYGGSSGTGGSNASAGVVHIR